MLSLFFNRFCHTSRWVKNGRSSDLTGLTMRWNLKKNQDLIVPDTGLYAIVGTAVQPGEMGSHGADFRVKSVYETRRRNPEAAGSARPRHSNREHRPTLCGAEPVV